MARARHRNGDAAPRRCCSCHSGCAVARRALPTPRVPTWHERCTRAFYMRTRAALRHTCGQCAAPCPCVCSCEESTRSHVHVGTHHALCGWLLTAAQQLGGAPPPPLRQGRLRRTAAVPRLRRFALLKHERREAFKDDATLRIMPRTQTREEAMRMVRAHTHSHRARAYPSGEDNGRHVGGGAAKARWETRGPLRHGHIQSGMPQLSGTHAAAL